MLNSGLPDDFNRLVNLIALQLQIYRNFLFYFQAIRWTHIISPKASHFTRVTLTLMANVRKENHKDWEFVIISSICFSKG